MRDFGYEQRAVIDGDCRSAAIAAASVLAKVTRDRYMRRAAERHPGWDFETNVGYSTPEHRAAIAANGISPLHRLSFQSIAYQQLAIDAYAATPAPWRSRACILDAPSERVLHVLERQSRPPGSSVTPIASKRMRRCAAARRRARAALASHCAAILPHLAPLAGADRGQRAERAPGRVARRTRVLTSQKTRKRPSRATTSISP